MKKPFHLANAIVWAAAIMAAALSGAPSVLSLIVLPTLAAMSLLIGDRQACLQGSARS